MPRFIAPLALAAVTALAALPVTASEGFTFDSIDGGTIDTGDWQGQPVLVVNTASRCGFTPQFDGLQALYDRYRDEGLVVLTVPSDDFRQELGSEQEVKDFCELNFDLDMPMTTITHVTGTDAHPLYQWLADEGFTPGWNFNKALIGPDGSFVSGWGAATKPMSDAITSKIEALLH